MILVVTINGILLLVVLCNRYIIIYAPIYVSVAPVAIVPITAAIKAVSHFCVSVNIVTARPPTIQSVLQYYLPSGYEVRSDFAFFGSWGVK
jgi:hypothetical protein